jgi:hypothetical protein
MEEKNKPSPANQKGESNFIAMEAHPNPEKVGADHFTNKIPTEIAFLIFSFLDLKSLCLSSLVSKHWNQLANDELLWKEQLKRYSQDHLWRYLFKIPDKSSYQKYFSEILLKPSLTSDNFFKATKVTKEYLFQFIKLTRISERKEIIEKYFQQIDVDKTSNLLDELINEVQGLSAEVRSKFIDEDLADLTRSQVLSKLIIILRQINSIEALLTNQFYLYKFFSLYPKKLNELNASIAAILKPSTIIVIIACVGERILLNTPLLCHALLNKLYSHELIECAICSEDIAEFILRKTSLINRLSDDDLRTIFYKTSVYVLEKTFFEILNENPLFLSRCTADFLIKLVESMDQRQLRYIPNLILGHPVLINRLKEDQCIEILLKRKKAGQVCTSPILLIDR